MRTIRLAWPSNINDELETEEVFLSPAQSRHGVLVLRLSVGDKVEALGPKGLAEAVVSTSSKAKPFPRLGLTLSGPWRKPPHQPGPRLALALINASRFDWAVEKAVELGASALIPLITERTKTGPGERPGPAKEERWLRLAEEARKQCGRSDSLEIYPVFELKELVSLPGPKFFLNPAAASSIRPAAADSPLLAVGPEGGFSPAEEKILLEADFQPWRLGSIILRAETAALAALAQLIV